ncbi:MULTISPECIES: hypothetical protein [Nonomuraea]|uniref:Uncharacterized protein n=1 Tax=Nonomuraea mangrovi TaxID=2316207 RepID=A0ABW4T684_9ACTN
MARDHHDSVAAAKRDLRAALDRDRAALGDDQYGVELHRNLPTIEREVYAAFDAYLAELDDMDTGLQANATLYEGVEHVNGGTG